MSKPDVLEELQEQIALRKMMDAPRKLLGDAAAEIASLRAEVARLTAFKEPGREAWTREDYAKTLAEAVEQVRALTEQDADLVAALEESPCKCRCTTHGFGCGLQEATCRWDKRQCIRCAALARHHERTK